MDHALVFHGAVIHPVTPQALGVLEDAIVVVNQSGRVVFLEAGFPRLLAERIVLSATDLAAKSTDQNDATSLLAARVKAVLTDLGPFSTHFLDRGAFLIPGFVDTHNHAPQWQMRGLGQGLHILDWLDQVTFPSEARFADAAYATRVYEDCVGGFLRQGITTASYYGSMHGEATRILADVCLRKGQRAFVGKCNMDRNAPDYYKDADAAESLRETELCIAHVRKIDPRYELVRPVLTPRFAITCTPELLAGLGRIARSHPDLPIQTHFDEAEQEIKATKQLFPEFDNEVDLYGHFGLLGKRSILAHCTIITDYEKDKLKELGCGIAHCPVSNMTVGGGFMAAPVRDFLRREIKVGLGTDSGGGFSSSMLDVIRQAFIASNAREAMSSGADRHLSLEEGFYLATLGGAAVCGLDGEIGNFAVGKQFDALVVRTVGKHRGVMTMVEPDDGLRTIFEKFIMTGDDRNIDKVYVRGVVVKESE